MRIILTILLALSLSNGAVIACDSLWVDNISYERDGIYSAIKNISKNESLPVTVIPKAIVYARQFGEPDLMMHQMDTIKVASWKVIISNQCDIEKIRKLEKINRNTLSKYNLNSDKRININYAGTDIRPVVDSFSKFCNVPVAMSGNLENTTRIWASSGAYVSCLDMLGLLAVNGVKLTLIEGKIVAEKA